MLNNIYGGEEDDAPPPQQARHPPDKETLKSIIDVKEDVRLQRDRVNAELLRSREQAADAPYVSASLDGSCAAAAAVAPGSAVGFPLPGASLKEFSDTCCLLSTFSIINDALLSPQRE